MRTIDKINYYLAKQQKNGSDLCEYLGVSSGVYSQWNTGRTNPRKSKMPVIAEYLGVNVEDIQGEDETKKENAPGSDSESEIEKALAQATPAQRELINSILGMNENQLLFVKELVDKAKKLVE